MTLVESVPASLRESSGPVLETERLILRAPRLGDVKAIAALASDRRVAENTARIPHPYHVSDAEDFVCSAAAADAGPVFVITLPDGELVGACGLTGAGASAELGYWLGVSYWGRGYGTEAVRGLIDHAFTALSYTCLEAGARVTNPASRRILEKCGFQWTGVGLYRIRAIASSAPIDRFRLERRIWESLKGWREPRRL